MLVFMFLFLLLDNIEVSSLKYALNMDILWPREVGIADGNSTICCITDYIPPYVTYTLYCRLLPLPYPPPPPPPPPAKKIFNLKSTTKTNPTNNTKF